MAKSMVKGLSLLRQNTIDKSPKHSCSNCKCKRYSPCTCERKQGKETPKEE